jgi:hypothetical protein
MIASGDKAITERRNWLIQQPEDVMTNLRDNPTSNGYQASRINLPIASMSILEYSSTEDLDVNSDTG